MASVAKNGKSATQVKSSQKPFECHHCNRKFAAKGDLYQHCRDSHPKTSSEFSDMALTTVNQRAAHTKMDLSGTTRTASLGPPRLVSSKKPFECDRCHRRFATDSSLMQHRKDSHPVKPFECQNCHRWFQRETDLHQHCKDSHPGSSSTPRIVKYASQPLVSPNKWTCAVCQATYRDFVDLQSHKRTESHCFCHECQLYFSDEPSLKAHYEALLHASHFRCCDCSKDFLDEKALDRHLQDKIHKQFQCQICHQTLGGYKAFDLHVVKAHGAPANKKRRLYLEKSNACYACQREFKNKTALDQHLKSLLHHPLSDLKCIASSKCKARFSSPSALLHHLESGSCCSGVSRQDIHDLVRAHDTERTISQGRPAQKFIDMHLNPMDIDSSSSGTPIMTPTSSASNSPILTGEQTLDSLLPRLQSLSTGNANSRANVSLPDLEMIASKGSLKCPLCPGKSKVFINLGALQSHLSSCVHDLKRFHCPVGISHSSIPGTKMPIKHFSTLGGLAQHVESGACGDGAETMRKAIELVQGKLQALGFEGLRLLK